MFKEKDAKIDMLRQDIINECDEEGYRFIEENLNLFDQLLLNRWCCVAYWRGWNHNLFNRLLWNRWC